MTATLRQEEEVRLRGYLLGEMSEESRRTIERRLLTEPASFSELLAVEECLIDQYVDGKLTARERTAFELYFVNDRERRERVEFARVFRRYLSDQAASRLATIEHSHRNASLRRILPGAISVGSTGAGLVLLCLVLLLGASSVLLFRKTLLLRKQAEHLRIQESFPRPGTQGDAQIGRGSPLPTPAQGRGDEAHSDPAGRKGDGGRSGNNPETIFLTLFSGLDRTAHHGSNVMLTATARTVRLRLQLAEGGYQSYSAELQSVEGEVVWSRAALGPEGRHNSLAISLPVALLTRSDYVVLLTGTTASGERERAGTYYFNVVNRHTGDSLHRP